MATVVTREDLINYCLRKLGEPVIEVNVDEDQIEDRIDDAIQTFRTWHSDATQRTYYQHQLTAEDIANKFIRLPSRILYVTKLFPVSSSFVDSTNMFSFKYQMALSDVHALSDMGYGNLAYYDQMRSYAELIDMKLSGLPIIGYTRKLDKLHLWSDIEDGDLKEGDYICIECFEVVPTIDEEQIHPGDASTVYNDTFVKAYATAKIKEQWGMNLSKFEGMQLPGGVTINGRQLLEDAREELSSLKENMILEHEEPPMFLVG